MKAFSFVKAEGITTISNGNEEKEYKGITVFINPNHITEVEEKGEENIIVKLKNKEWFLCRKLSGQPYNTSKPFALAMLQLIGIVEHHDGQLMTEYANGYNKTMDIDKVKYYSTEDKTLLVSTLTKNEYYKCKELKVYSVDDAGSIAKEQNYD